MCFDKRISVILNLIVIYGYQTCQDPRHTTIVLESSYDS